MNRWDYFNIPKIDGGQVEYRVGTLEGVEVTQERIWLSESSGTQLWKKACAGQYDLTEIEVHGGGNCYLVSGWKTITVDEQYLEELLAS